MLLRKLGFTGHFLVAAVVMALASVGIVASQDESQATRKPSRTSFEIGRAHV